MGGARKLAECRFCKGPKTWRGRLVSSFDGGLEDLVELEPGPVVEGEAELRTVVRQQSKRVCEKCVPRVAEILRLGKKRRPVSGPTGEKKRACVVKQVVCRGE